MELLILYFVSIITSISIELVGELSIIKELAQKGYKLDIIATSKKISQNSKIKNLLIKTIPIYNIIYSTKQVKKYENIKNELLEKPEETNIIVKMNNIEKTLFEEKPKSVTALNIAISQIEEENYKMPKGYITIHNGTYRHIFNDRTYNEIKFKKESNRIIVYSIEGKIKELNKVELQNELNKIFNAIYNLDAYIEEPTSITKQKEMLIEHKNEILSQEKTLTLRRKED